MNAADDPQAWILKARHGLLCIDNNLAAAQIPWDIVAFHSQQAAEKALKALLVSRGEVVAKVHDLLVLLEECRASGEELIGLDADCRRLTQYAVQFRYPASGRDLGEADAREAVAAAKRVFDAILALL